MPKSSRSGREYAIIYLTKYHYKADETTTAIEVAECVLATDPTSSFLTVHLASLHRASGHHDLALKVFRESKITLADRPYYSEWGVVERASNNYYAAIWMASLVIRDLTGISGVTNDDCKIALSEFCLSGLKIFRLYNDQDYLLLACAAKKAAFLLPIVNADREFFNTKLEGFWDSRVNNYTIQDLVRNFDTTSRMARERASQGSAPLPPVELAVGLNSLELLLKNATRQVR